MGLYQLISRGAPAKPRPGHPMGIRRYGAVWSMVIRCGKSQWIDDESSPKMANLLSGYD